MSAKLPDVPANKLPQVDVADKIPEVPTHIPSSGSPIEGKKRIQNQQKKKNFF
jgi:hypothetical protein